MNPTLPKRPYSRQKAGRTIPTLFIALLSSFAGNYSLDADETRIQNADFGVIVKNIGKGWEWDGPLNEGPDRNLYYTRLVPNPVDGGTLLLYQRKYVPNSGSYPESRKLISEPSDGCSADVPIRSLLSWNMPDIVTASCVAHDLNYRAPWEKAVLPDGSQFNSIFARALCDDLFLMHLLAETQPQDAGKCAIMYSAVKEWGKESYKQGAGDRKHSDLVKNGGTMFILNDSNVNITVTMEYDMEVGGTTSANKVTKITAGPNEIRAIPISMESRNGKFNIYDQTTQKLIHTYGTNEKPINLPTVSHISVRNNEETGKLEVEAGKITARY